MITWVVTGQRLVETEGGWEWEDFTHKCEAATLGEARWDARRAMAAGDQLAELEACPPRESRERIEIAAPNTLEEAVKQGTVFFSPRTEARTEDEQAEYERLVDTVKITEVINQDEVSDAA